MAKSDNFLGWEKPGKAFITGASAGMGLCFATELAQKKFDLVLLARRKDRLEAAAEKLSSDFAVRCDIIPTDLSNIDNINKAVELIQKIDSLDILINNAGFATVGNFADVPLEKSIRMLHLHMAAPVLLAHAALQGMLKRKRGAVINVSSIGAFALTPGNVMYDATKSFLATFSENLHLEIKDAGIRIQSLCPGFTHTEFHEVGDFEDFDRSIIPNHLWMTPEEVVFLSLKALEKNKEIVFIPGWKNRFSKWMILHSSVVRSIVQQKVKERNEK